MGIKSLGNKKSISYAAVWDETGTGAMDPPARVWGAVARYGNRGVVICGYNTANINTIQYFNTTSPGNASDFGDFIISTRGGSALSGAGEAHRGLFGGGYGSDWDDEIGYFTIATPGNASDFGNLTGTGQWAASMTSGTRGVWASKSESSDICYITIATTGDATDFGDLTAARGAAAGASSELRGLIMGGHLDNRIDYITIATPGNASDFGDLTNSVRWGAGLSSAAGRAVRGAGKNNSSGGLENVIDYVTITNLGNATDFGDLSAQAENLSGCSNGTRGLFSGGSTSGGYVNEIQYITISTTGDATDFGDLLTVLGSSGSTTGTDGS